MFYSHVPASRGPLHRSVRACACGVSPGPRLMSSPAKLGLEPHHEVPNVSLNGCKAWDGLFVVWLLGTTPWSATFVPCLIASLP